LLSWVACRDFSRRELTEAIGHHAIQKIKRLKLTEAIGHHAIEKNKLLKLTVAKSITVAT